MQKHYYKLRTFFLCQLLKRHCYSYWHSLKFPYTRVAIQCHRCRKYHPAYLEGLDSYFKGFEGICEDMTQEQAEFIRKLRVDGDYTWRELAEECYDQNWENFGDWSPPSNQLMGVALCDRASRFFGEDYMVAPWD